MRHFLGRLDNKSDLSYHLIGVPTHFTSPIPQGTFSTFGFPLSHGRTQKVRGFQSSSGTLKHLALKCKSGIFNCVSPTNSRTQHVFTSSFYFYKLTQVKFEVLDELKYSLSYL